MAWVVGIGIALFLLAAFPKQMAAIVGFCLLIVLAIFAYFWIDGRNAENRRSQIAISASYDIERCSADHPILVAMQNKSRMTVTRISFSLSGYNPGFSEPVSTKYSLSSDRILTPGAAYGACWQFYQPSYKPPINAPSLRWEAKVTSVLMD